MTNEINMMNEELNVEALEAVNGGDCSVTLDGKKVLCKIYVVKKGDNLSKLALRFNTNIKAIMKVNPIIKNPNRINAGWTLRIPVNYKLK